jgi:hypothetical protein
MSVKSLSKAVKEHPATPFSQIGLLASFAQEEKHHVACLA